jgi:hypothetical protein
MIAMLAVANTLAFSLEIIRYQDKNRKIPKSPPGSTVVLVLTLTMMSCYVGEFIGRLVTSLNSLICLEDYNTKLQDISYDPTQDTHLTVYYPDLFYPFQVCAECQILIVPFNLLSTSLIQPGYINLTSKYTLHNVVT